LVSVPIEQVARRSRAPRGSGDLLRDEILDATTDLLLETGHARSVSIRSVAQRVRVTPPSIYLHFTDKAALLDAVCARYFERLDLEMQRAAQEHSAPVDALRAQGQAYVRFAIQTPELYRIATMGEYRSGRDVDVVLDSSAFQHIRATVQALVDDGLRLQDDPSTIALELWAAAHGVAAMLIAKPHLPFGEVEAFADRVFRSAFVGRVVVGLVGADMEPRDFVAWAKAQTAVEEP
jgi:AcrR family transcriptional regulator